jgi:predicted nucleic acid-binding protein
MGLVDVNILLNAVHTASPDHERAKAWLDERLRVRETVGLPWAVLVASCGLRQIHASPHIHLRSTKR